MFENIFCKFCEIRIPAELRKLADAHGFEHSEFFL